MNKTLKTVLKVFGIVFGVLVALTAIAIFVTPLVG